MNKTIILNIVELIKYNLKVIFGGKFIWFLLMSVIIFIAFMFQTAYTADKIDTQNVFSLMQLPSFLIIFYPTIYGIQNDADSKTLEILFGIPNYRYKVWGIRLLIIFITLIFMQLIFSELASVLLYPVDIVDMTFQSFLPILSLGCIAFMVSTITKNGNAAALIMIIILLYCTTTSGNNSIWNIFLNPFKEQNHMHPDYWQEIILKNKIFLICASIITLLIGFYNLQNREKFIR